VPVHVVGEDNASDLSFVSVVIIGDGGVEVLGSFILV